MSKIFTPGFRSAHEPRIDQLGTLIEQRWSGQVEEESLRRQLRRRDETLWLECEASHPIAWFSDILSHDFPESKFILTVRDCYSWLESIINQHINNPHSTQSVHGRRRALYYGGTYSSAYALSENMGVYTLDGYLSYWSRHNSFVLDSVPPHRLMVIPTFDIAQHLGGISTFMGISTTEINSERSHSHIGGKKHGVLSQIDRDLLISKIEQYCRPTIDRLGDYQHVTGYDLVGA